MREIDTATGLELGISFLHFRYERGFSWRNGRVQNGDKILQVGMGPKVRALTYVN